MKWKDLKGSGHDLT